MAQAVSESTSDEQEPKKLGQDYTRFLDFLTERQWLQLQATTALEEAQAILYPVLGRLGLRTPSEPTWGAIMTFLYLLLGLTFPEPLACYQELQKMKSNAKKIMAKGGNPPVMVWKLPDRYTDLPEEIRQFCFLDEAPVVCKIARERLEFAALKVPLRKSDIRVQAALQPKSSSSFASDSALVSAVHAAQLVMGWQAQLPAVAPVAVPQQPQPTQLALMDRDRTMPAEAVAPLIHPAAAEEKSVLPAAQPEAAPETSSNVPAELQLLREELGQSEEQRCKAKRAAPAAEEEGTKKKPAASLQAVGSKQQPQKKPAACSTAVAMACGIEKLEPGSPEEFSWRLSKGIPKDVLQKFRQGCSKCRWRAGCTPCCWRGRGYDL